MNLLWLYLASILPATLLAGYILARLGFESRGRSSMATALGCFWPLMIPMLILVFLLGMAERAGERARESARKGGG